MMAFQFDPTDGLLNGNVFPTVPESETAARQQFQTLLNQIRDAINAHLADYSALGKIEYVYIPEGTQTKFDVPLRTSLFFVLTENNDDKTTIINVTRFGIGGLVYQTVVSGSAITIQTNADRSAVFLTPTFSVRGFVVRARQPI